MTWTLNGAAIEQTPWPGVGAGGEQALHVTLEAGTSYRLALDSNPEFTGSVAAATARAVARMADDGVRGAITLFDIPPAKLSPRDPVELRKHLL